MKDLKGFQIVHKRVEFVLEFGVWGDSEGRTWAKDLKSSEVFSTRKAAQDALEASEFTKLSPWGDWRTTYDYGHVRIRQREVDVSDEDLMTVIKDDAYNWGVALNDAGWKFVDVCPEKSALLFNHTKPALRDAIALYLDKVGAAK